MKKKVVLFLIVLLSFAVFCGLANADGVWPESAHPYEANTDITWTYTHPEPANHLVLSFRADSEVENGYDYLYITDGDRQEQVLTGSLSGKIVSGNSFTIRLTSDGIVQKKGFAFASIAGTDEPPEILNEPCGDHVTWMLEDGVITISGKRDMYNYAQYGTVPWKSDSNQITSVNIEYGVTSIGDYAFEYCYLTFP